MQHYIVGKNIGLVVGRQGQVVGNMPWNLIFVTTKPTDMNIFYRGGGINFRYILIQLQQTDILNNNAKRTPNLNLKIISKLQLIYPSFTNEKQSKENSFAQLIF